MSFLLVGAIFIMLIIIIYMIESGGLLQMADAFVAIIIGSILLVGAALTWFFCVVFDF